MTVERRALSGSIVTGLAVLVQFGQAFVLVPLFLTQWGKEKYGLWLGLLAAQSLVITLDAGHQAFIGNELNRLYPVDRDQAKRVLASSIWIALFLGMVEAGIGVVLWLGGALPALLGTTAEKVAAHHLAPAMMAYLIVWAITGSVGGILARTLPPTGRYTRAAAWGVASQLMLLAVWAGGLLLGLQILTLMLCQVIAQLMYSAVVFLDIRDVCRELYPFWSPADLRLGFRNLSRSIVLTGTTLLTQLQQNGVNLLVSTLFGAAVLPALTTVRTLANVFMQGTNVVAGPIAPDVVRYHVMQEPRKLIGAWAGIWFVGGALINVGLVASLAVVQPFYAYWTRGKMSLGWSLFLPLAAAVAMKSFAVPMLTLLTGINHLRALTVLSAAQAFTVLVGTWALSSAMGIDGTAVAILLSELVGSLIVVAYVRATLAERGVSFPWRHLATAALAPAVSCSAFLVVGLTKTTDLTVALATLPVLTSVLVVHWRSLPSEVKTRLLGLVPRR